MRTIEAEPGHASLLLARMSDEQRNRFIEMHGPTAERQIIGNIVRSPMTWCGLDEVGVVNLGGVYPIDPVGTGLVWQFITPAVKMHKRDYILQGNAMVKSAMSLFVCIVAPIEAEYRAAVRHARRLGMAVSRTETVAGLPVCFCMKARA